MGSTAYKPVSDITCARYDLFHLVLDMELLVSASALGGEVGFDGGKAFLMSLAIAKRWAV